MYNHYMSAKLTSYSQSVNVNESLQDTIAFCARVSNPTNQNNSKTNEKLLEYLIKHHHWSPFEMVSICLEINTTRDIARQLLRHRSFSFQEFSQRYAVVNEPFMTKEARLQDHTNRQNSIVTEDDALHLFSFKTPAKRAVMSGEGDADCASSMRNGVKQSWIEKQIEIAEKSQQIYTWALDNGIAKEQARTVLPEGMTPSRMYVNGTVRSWIHYIQLRTSIETQKEHRELTLACAEAIAPIFPYILSFCSNSRENNSST